MARDDTIFGVRVHLVRRVVEERKDLRVRVISLEKEKRKNMDAVHVFVNDTP